MQLGDIIDGKYRLAKRLRAGGMGAVYVADRIALGDSVAIKIILPNQDGDVSRARFLREARAVARIRHPNVVQIFDFGEAGDVPYIVMELLEGRSLDEELKLAGRLPLARAAEIFRPATAAVEAGHRRGVLHRDIKPGNVFIAHMDDGREAVKVLDFGLARLTHEHESRQLTSPGALLGTYAYMSPEQILDEPVTPASDVYSLGIVLYEMLTGRLPYQAPSAFALMDRIVSGRHPHVKTLVPDLPEEVAVAAEAALSRDPAARPVSAEAFGEIVARAAGVEEAPRAAAASPAGPSAEHSVSPTVIAETGDPRPTDENVTRNYVAGSVGLDTPSPSTPITQASDWPAIECFVDREAELETLKSEFTATQRGDSRMIVAVGEAGVGKTVLVRAFASWAAEQGARVLTSRFFDYEGNRPAPFDAFLTMLTATCAPGEGETVLSVEERLAGILSSSPTRGDRFLGEDAEKWRAFATLTAEFERLGAERPLVLVFDDLQWAGRMHLELIAYIRRNLVRARAFIAGTARDVGVQSSSGSDLDAWLLGEGGRRGCTVLGVKPFGPEEVREWLTTSFGRVRIRTLDVRRLVEATGGNPYYLREVVRHLLGTGAFERGVDGWRCAPLDDTPLPETVANAVRAQLQGLDETMRDVLQAAAVIGDHFRFETLLDATGLEERELEEIVERAVDLQFFTEEGVARPDDYRFYSNTLQRVLYHDMSARRRRRCHERVVGALERVYGDRLDRLARTLCYHHHAVGTWSEALKWGVRSGEEALARSDLDAAEVSLSRARESAEHMRAEGDLPDPETALRLDLLWGTFRARLGKPEEARALLRTVASEAARMGREDMRADALLEIANCNLSRGDLENALERADESARVAEAAGERARGLTARIFAGAVLRRLGRMGDAGERFDRVFADLEETDPPSLRSLASQNLAWIRAQHGAFREAEDLAGLALELARAARDPIAEQQAYSTLAFVRVEMGDAEKALELHEASLCLSRSLAIRRREGIDLANVGEAYYLLDRWEEALERFDEALAIFVEIGDRACEGDCRVNMGRTLLASTRTDEALAMLERGIAICEQTGRREYEAIGQFYLGEARLGRGELDAARAAFERSHEIFLDLRWHDAWRIEHALARTALASGDRAGARAHVAEALARVEQSRANLPPTADYARFSRQVAELVELSEALGIHKDGPDKPVP